MSEDTPVIRATGINENYPGQAQICGDCDRWICHSVAFKAYFESHNYFFESREREMPATQAVALPAMP